MGFWNKSDLRKTFSQQETECNRACFLIERLKKASVFGGSVVDQSLNNGVEVLFSCELGKTEGFYTQNDQENSKKIVLNAQMSDERLMSSLVRLARYAEQGNVLDSKMTLHAAVTTARAKVADARAVEAVAAYEMRFCEPEAYQAFFENNKLMAGCCYYAMRATNDISEGLRRAAKAWYDKPVQKMDGFDDNVISAVSAKGMREEGSFSSGVSVENLCKMFSYSGRSYMDADFLCGTLPNRISETMAQKIERIEKYHKQTFGGHSSKKIRTSADCFNVVCSDGTVRSAQKPVSVFARLSASKNRC